ncbi:hypothetical protein C6N40_07385, partial [Arenimonas caeni]
MVARAGRAGRGRGGRCPALADRRGREPADDRGACPGRGRGGTGWRAGVRTGGAIGCHARAPASSRKPEGERA